MAGLQRSAVSFRRQGSSGLVWDDRVLTEEQNQTKKDNEGGEGGDVEFREMRASQSVSLAATREGSSAAAASMRRSRSGGAGRTWRTGKVSPAIDPPSPKVSACGFCVFGKPPSDKRQKKVSRKR
ncbi:hypothetical protein ACLOJK_031971 [Asimina triloba]